MKRIILRAAGVGIMIPAACLFLTACFSPFTGEPLFEGLGRSAHCKEQINAWEGCTSLSMIKWLGCEKSGKDCVIDMFAEFSVCGALISEQCYKEYNNE